MATLDPTVVYSLARNAGATVEEATILTAIAKGESGWRTEAHNPKPPDDSYGLWQINMLGAMGDSRLKQWGFTSKSQLFNPLNNAVAALSILRGQGLKAWSVYTNGSYKANMDAARQAAMTAEPRYKEIAYYTSGQPADQWGVGAGAATATGDAGVGDFIGGSDGGDGMGGFSTGGTGVAPLPQNATPEQIDAYIRENFPQAAGFLDIPEIRSKLIEAAQNQWTSTKLQAEIQATAWWRTNGAAARNFFALKGADPAQMESLIAAKVSEWGPELQQLGINLGGPEGVKKWAENAIKYGWTADQVREKFAGQLAKKSKRDGLAEGSAPDLSADALVSMARNDYFLPISRQDAERWAVDIFSGAKSEEQMRSYFARLASSRFPGLEEQGFTPGEYMAPVRNMIAETLEMNPADVNLLDKRWSEVLEMQGADGKFRPMTFGEAGRWARKRPEYQQTTGAMDEGAALVESLGKAFGKVG
jgi:hypothetical protein